MDDLRALLVTYVFPPTGGAGVGRVLKLAKYLGHHGVTPSVLTVANPSVPLRDESLLRDVPAGMEVIRARTLEPGYGVKKAAWSASADPNKAAKPSLKGRAVALARQVLIPDPQVLWQPGAQLALARRMRSPAADDLVFISAPPFSELLLGPTVRAFRGKALVLDYRDEWSTLRDSYEMVKGGLAARVGEPLERVLLRRAHAVTTATEAFRKNLLDRFSFLRPERVFAIPNGYDREDFAGDLPKPSGEKLTLTYAGTIFRLTSARGLLGAIKRLHRDSPELARLLHVQFIGRIVETELDAFEGTDALGVERLGYVSHKRVIGELSRSHAVLCLLDDVPGVERIYPAKIFELMAMQRPCFTLAPPGALTELVEAHGLGTILAPRDEPAIARALAELLTAFRDGRPLPTPTPRGIERFDRKNLAGEYADVFRSAVRWAREPDRPAR